MRSRAPRGGNGLRTKDFREILDTLVLAAAVGKFVMLKGWPGFNWLDAEIMRRPFGEMLQLVRERVTFQLWRGLTATREFAHASVWVDLQAKQAKIDWH